MTTDGKVHVSYLEDIFEKLCSLNIQLPKANTKAELFGFVIFLSLWKNNILSKCYDKFPWLKECEVTQEAYTCRQRGRVVKAPGS